jgi:hypothetical protein
MSANKMDASGTSQKLLHTSALLDQVLMLLLQDLLILLQDLLILLPQLLIAKLIIFMLFVLQTHNANGKSVLTDKVFQFQPK